MTALGPDGPVEVTTLRHDVATDGRHATVAFTDDWRADAARRDFTMNALYAEAETGAVHDYWGGRADLTARRVRFIGDPATRIAEDRLRVLRFFRFTRALWRGAGRGGAGGLRRRRRLAGPTVGGAGRERASAAAGAPRIRPHARRDGRRGRAGGRCCPKGATSPHTRALVAAERAAGVKPDPVRALAALLPADPGVAETTARRLRLSNADRDRLVTARRATGW